MKGFKCLILLAIMNTQVYSQEVAMQINSKGKVVCLDEVNFIGHKSCTYTLINLTRGQELIRKIEQILFKGEPLSLPDGMMEILGSNSKVISFWHKDIKVMEQIKNIIPLLDTKEDFSSNTIVEFKADIYEISESGLSSLGAEITNLKVGAGIDDLVDGVGANSDGNGLGLDLKLGVVQLSGLLSAERQKGRLKKSITISRPVPNLSSIEYDDITNIYSSPGAAGTEIKTDKTGVSLDGVVSVNHENEKLVTVKGFKITYGTKNSDGSVNILTLPYENLVVQEGIAFPLISSKSIGTYKGNTTKLLGFNIGRSKEEARLLVYVTVKVKSWDEYIEHIKDILVVGKQKFSKSEVEKLSSECVSVNHLLRDLKLIATRDLNGDPVLSLMLNKENACKTNLKKRIKIKISGNGISKKENSKFTTVESLMHIPMKINDLSLEKLRKSLLRFKYSAELVDKGMKTKVSEKLYFAPNDYNLAESFWMN